MLKRIPALPSDVRWRLCPTVKCVNLNGTAPQLWAEPHSYFSIRRKVKDLPHIERRSRNSNFDSVTESIAHSQNFRAQLRMIDEVFIELAQGCG